VPACGVLVVCLANKNLKNDANLAEISVQLQLTGLLSQKLNDRIVLGLKEATQQSSKGHLKKRGARKDLRSISFCIGYRL
jgi:hypothetical protein